MSRENNGDRPHERSNRGRRLDRMTDLERQADDEKWESIIRSSHLEEEEMEEGSEEDSEFDGLEENDHFDEEDYFTSENESFRSDDFEANKARAEDCKEENVKKRERELIENNLRDFPFFRGVMAAIDVHPCNRVQHSYIELPPSFKFGKCSGREGDAICQRELNDRFVGVPPLIRGARIAIMSNLPKAVLLAGEDRLYEIDIATYQAKMSLRYLIEFLGSEGPKREAALKKFQKHAGPIDSYFKEANLAIEVENIMTQLTALISLREKYRSMEAEEHSRRSSCLFEKSLNQQFHNKLHEDKCHFTEAMKDFLLLRQLQYECILELEHKDKEGFKTEASIFCEPYMFFKMSLRTASSEAPSDSTEKRLRNHQSTAQDADEKPAKDEAPPETPSKKKQSPSKEHLRSHLSSQNLWPLFMFDATQPVVLKSCFSIIFETIDAERDESAKYSLQLCLFKILGRLFGINKTDFLSPGPESNLNPAALPGIFEQLQRHQRTVQEGLKELDFEQAAERPFDFSELGSFTQSSEVFEAMSKGRHFTNKLELFKAGDFELVPFYSTETVTKIILLFFNLYQRLLMVWTGFGKISQSQRDFDQLKQFTCFKDFLVQTLILRQSFEGMPDAELFFSHMLGDIGHLICNIPQLANRIYKRLQSVSVEYSFKELLSNNEANLPSNEIIKFMNEKFSIKGVFLFQLCLFDKRAKRVYIYNIVHNNTQLADSPQKSLA